MTEEELWKEILSIKKGTVIPKPVSKNAFFVKGIGRRRNADALIYTIPSHSEKHQNPYEKGITKNEFFMAYTELESTGKFTRDFFKRNLKKCNLEGGCNFTSIGGVFELLKICKYKKRGLYIKVD